MRIFRSFVLVLAMGASSLVLGMSSPVGAVAPPAGAALINGDTVSGGTSSREAQAATAAGLTVTVVTGAEWDAMTAAQFASYQVLIAGDPYCGRIAGSFTSNESTWGPVVMGTAGGNTFAGNRVVVGTDPVEHSGSHPGALTLINDGVAYAGSQPGRTGLYFDTSCGGNYYGQGGLAASILGPLSTGSGSWTENDSPPCGGNVAKIASTTSFDSLHSSNIAGWSCSVHESFPTFPSDWHALAIATDTATQPTCGTDVDTSLPACGQAYVLIAGSDIVVTSPDLTLLPATGSDASGGSHTVTATVTRSGAAVSGATVTFTVTGVNAGVTGTCSVAADCTTDANGQVSFTYPDTNGPGDDTITASFTDASSGRLQSATASETWTSAPQTITVTPDNQSITYGDATPTYTWTTSSTGTDTLVTPPTCDVAGAPTAAGSYTIACSGATAPAGDTVVYNTGTLAIAPAPLTVTADDQSAVFGAGDPTFTSSVSGLLNGDTLTTPATCSVVGAHRDAASYPITCTGADAGANYTISYQPGSLSVTKAPVVVTADNQSAIYGSADPTFTATATGLLGEDGLTTPATCSVDGAHTDVGTYPITCSGADAGGNYAITYHAGTLTVTAKPITIGADSSSVVYGQPTPSFTSTTTGLVNGDSLVTRATCDVAGAHTAAGSYPITCTGADAGANYTISYLDGTYTVATKPGVVTADDQTMTYGSSEPAYTYTVSGLQPDESLATAPTCAVVGAHHDVGSYPIVCGGGSDANYSLSYVAGTLTVTKAALAITADNQATTYGSAVPALTSTTTGLIGDDTVTTPATCTVTGAHSAAGTYPISCAGADAGGNYTISYHDGTLSVAKAGLVVHAGSYTRHFGVANPAFSATITGYLKGDGSRVVSGAPALRTAASRYTHPGFYPITASQGSLSAANYTFTFVPGSLHITKAAVNLATHSTTTVHRHRKHPFRYTFTTKVTNASTGAPVPGAVVTIRAGRTTVCTARTNNHGIATCTNTKPVDIDWIRPYTATTGATTDYTSGRASAVVYAYCTHQTHGTPQQAADLIEDCLDGRTDN
jgi:hypothetical protein